jgi:hypothetical protein
MARRFRNCLLHSGGFAIRLVFIVTLSLYASQIFAQTGSLTGVVTDASGAVVPKASITATSNSTGIQQTTTTTSAGIYTFAALAPAHYTVVVNATGFQQTTFNDVVITIAQTVPLNAKLEVGSASTTVNVGAESPIPVETNSFQVSTIIDSKQISDLPLVLRDPYQLVLLSPGVVTASNNMGGFSVNGQRDRNNNFLLDGADNNDTSVPGIQGGISSANPDSAQEFRVISNNFDAEFGRNTGAIIDVVTRGGSNQFHGDAYEFGRYNALGARDFFNTKENGPQDPYVRNDFGASIGGPLWKDHTFFFLNGEAQRFRTTLTNSTIVPTAAFKSGVFTFIDPFDGSQTPVNLTTPNANNLSGLGQDPLIAKVFALAPVGQVDNGDGVSTTYFFPSPDALNGYTFTGRFDQKLTDRHQLTVRYQYGHSNESNPGHSEVLPGLGYYSEPSTSHNGVISIASTLSANTTNLFRAGYNQANPGFFCNHSGIDAITGVDSFGNGRDLTIPYFFSTANGTTGFGCGVLGDSNGQARLSSTLLFADTYSVTKGSHDLKFGGEYRSIKDSSYDNFSSRDTLAFNVFSTNGVNSYQWDGDPNSPTINAFEDLIWGAQGAIANETENQFFTKDGTRRSSDLTRFRQHEWALFGQDTWKVTPKFTAIIGLRYEFNGVPYENDGNFSNFYGDASAPLPSVGYFSFTDVGPGTGRQLYSDSWNLIEPRIGFAYDPTGTGKTAIRGGYGIFHDRIFDNLFGNARSNPPFEANFNSFPIGTTPVIAVASTQPFPFTLTPTANITNGDFLEPVVIDPHLKLPGSQSWNLGVQHQLGSDVALEANYIGSHTTHALREIDGAPPQPALVASVISACEAAGNQAADCEGSAQRNALYLGGTITDPAVNNTAFFHELFQTGAVNGNYNALQAKVTYRGNGLSLLGSYTYAHSLDNGSDPLAPGAGNSGLPRDTFDISREYGNSDFDVRHRGTAAVTYNLPIGRGTPHLASGFLGGIFEGIELSGIEQVQTGLPFDLRGTVDNLHTGVNNRPEMIGDPYPSGRGTITPQGKITGPNMTAFANAPFDENVSIGRNKFYGPGFVNTDVVFQKTQTIFERLKVVFRAESYNVFNHPNLTSPPAASLTLGSSTFGVSQSEVQQNDGTTGARQIQGAIKVVF